jgi:hypothetical protein
MAMTSPVYIQFNPDAGTRTPAWIIVRPTPTELAASWPWMD